MTAYRNEYKSFLHACEVLGCTEYRVDTPAGASCWDAAYMDFSTAENPNSAVCVHCINGADYCTSSGNPCTPYEYAVNMALACAAVGKIEDAALFHRYADAVRPSEGVFRL